MKNYIIWYYPKGGKPDSVTHVILRGKSAVSARRQFSLLYPLHTAYRIRVWH